MSNRLPNHLAVLFACGFATGEALGQERAYRPIDPRTMKAYADLGGTFGWFRFGQEYPFFLGSAGRKPGGLPGFGFRGSLPGNLPEVSVPFGLKVNAIHFDVKGLAGRKNLVTLELFRVDKVTGVSELAENRELTTLIMLGTRDGNLRQIAGFRHLQKLALPETRVTPDGLKVLAGLEKLHWLYFDPSRLTDDRLRALREIDRLHVLARAQAPDGGRPGGSAEEVATFDLRHTAVTAAGIKELAPLKNLTHLQLDPVQAKDETAAVLRKIGLLHALSGALGKNGARPKTAEEVVVLDLYLPLLTDASIKEFSAFRKVRLLRSSRLMTDAMVQEIEIFPDLEELILSNEQMTDRALSTLRKQGRVHVYSGAKRNRNSRTSGRPQSDDEVFELDLKGTKVTDAGLKALKGLTNLRLLRIDRTGVTFRGIEELKKDLPQIAIGR